MVDAPDTIDRVETAANIYVRLSGPEGETFEIPISELDLTKDVDVERIREMGLYPDGYAINAIDVDGSIMFAGDKVRLPDGGTRDLDDILFNDDGTPVIYDITIAHDAGDETDTDTVENCICTSSQYSASSGEATESTYEFIGQRIN